MAQIKLTANTRDAQQKIKQLRIDVERLDKDCKKPRKITVGSTSVGGRGAAGGNISVGGKNLGGVLKNGGKAVGAGASTFLGTFVGSALGQVVSGLIAFAPAITRATSGITGVGMRLKKFMTVLETYGNPQQEAVKRANSIDALDDERRAHGSRSLAEEAAYTQAFTDTAGTAAPMLLQKIMQLVGGAKSGVYSEMLDSWATLDKFGIKQEDLQLPIWEIMAKILKAYSAAGQDGMNELQPIMQKIFGNRYMAVIRKLGDGTSFLSAADVYKKEASDSIGNQETVLGTAAAVQRQQGLAAMQNYGLPDEAHKFALQGAENVYNTARLQRAMMGANATEELKPLFDEVVGDGMNLVGQAKGIPLLGGLISQFLPDEDKPSTDTNTADTNTTLADAQVHAPARTLPTNNQYYDPKSQIPGVILSERPIGNGYVQYKSFDLKGFSNMLSPATNLLDAIWGGDEPQPQQPKQDKANVDVVRGMDDLATELRKNTTASEQLNTTINKGNISNIVITGATATFS